MLPKEDPVMLSIFDISGQKVVGLLNEKQAAGCYEVFFNAE